MSGDAAVVCVVVGVRAQQPGVPDGLGSAPDGTATATTVQGAPRAGEVAPCGCGAGANDMCGSLRKLDVGTLASRRSRSTRATHCGRRLLCCRARVIGVVCHAAAGAIVGTRNVMASCASVVCM